MGHTSGVRGGRCGCWHLQRRAICNLVYLAIHKSARTRIRAHVVVIFVAFLVVVVVVRLVFLAFFFAFIRATLRCLPA